MQNVVLSSPGKLNLFLHVLGRREDGYHNIQTLFQFVDWCDTLSFHARSDDVVQLNTLINNSNYHLPQQDNLVWKAVSCFREEIACSRGVDIELHKNLPIGGGMGGGSSNAATTLLALNYLWEVRLSLEELMAIGAKLGADVPVFIYGHAAWGEGIGNELTAMILPEPWYVLVTPTPTVSIRTETLYQDPRLTEDSAALTIDHYHPGLGHNDFEKLLRIDVPEIARALDWLGQFAKSRITGTGSVVFAAFDTKEEAGKIASQAPAAYQARVVRGLNQSPLHKSNGYIYSG